MILYTHANDNLMNFYIHNSNSLSVKVYVKFNKLMFSPEKFTLVSDLL